ncbi:MAG: hypothetical protein COR54_13915 [Elusimicrobia bacterium CG22_combo_CG10-13_8_21_14_all_63_91]|nr:MAG: hypothetical protein COR54_13915 [Elusimicrobia bacterium CG22_combo_CG10-13_8_21_14_all_63_91]
MGPSLPAVRRLVQREAGIQNNRIVAIGRALQSSGLRQRWGNGLDSFDGAATYLMTRLGMSVFKDLAERDRFRDDLHRTVWLRGACAGRLKKFEREKRSEPQRSLWRCELFVSTQGQPLSVLDIEKLRLENSGRVLSVRWELHRWRPVAVVATPADHDLSALRAIFGDSRVVVLAEK